MKKPKMKKLTLNLIFCLTFVLFVVFVISSLMSFIASRRCQSLCSSKKALSHQTIKNGEFNLNDVCVCYYPDATETFVLN